jgi:hypothetical protein
MGVPAKDKSGRISDAEAQRAWMTSREWLAALPAAASLKGSRSSAPPFERIDTHTHIHRNAPASFAALEKGQ